MHLACVIQKYLFVLGVLVSWGHFAMLAPAQSTMELELRYQVPVEMDAERFHRLTRKEHWETEQTAVIVCDMWDSHHCVNAVRRVAQIAPRIDQFCKTLRDQGVLVIHAPSGCMEAYVGHPARKRATGVAEAESFPSDIDRWCDQIPAEEAAAYPVDQSDGGEDDDPLDHELWAQTLKADARDPRQPWQSQTPAIEIDGKRDFISDSGPEIWSVLQSGNIQNVILVGVHTNMCVLGRPFGLRRMAAAGKNVVLVRDLTDTMYNPAAWPFASHFTGTDLVVSHIERYVCPTISSDQVLGGEPLQFAKDKRIRLLAIVAEDEYRTEETLPQFAAKHLSDDFSVTFAFGSEEERNQIHGLSELEDADAVLISVRRRAMDPEDMQSLQEFVALGKPVIGIRTASHAFSLRGKPAPGGKALWESFDGDVLGGNYTGHFGNDLKAQISGAESDGVEKVLGKVPLGEVPSKGSLYKTMPLAEGTFPLLWGSLDGESHPVAWTYIRTDGGRTFYTSLGHPEDFEQPVFEAFLASGIRWACGLTPKGLEKVQQQNRRYSQGKGKQR